MGAQEPNSYLPERYFSDRAVTKHQDVLAAGYKVYLTVEGMKQDGASSNQIPWTSFDPVELYISKVYQSLHRLIKTNKFQNDLVPANIAHLEYNSVKAMTDIAAIKVPTPMSQEILNYSINMGNLHHAILPPKMAIVAFTEPDQPWI